MLNNKDISDYIYSDNTYQTIITGVIVTLGTIIGNNIITDNIHNSNLYYITQQTNISNTVINNDLSTNFMSNIRVASDESWLFRDNSIERIKQSILWVKSNPRRNKIYKIVDKE